MAPPRKSGGIVVDMGIHYADLLEYFSDLFARVFGFNGVIDKRPGGRRGAVARGGCGRSIGRRGPVRERRDRQLGDRSGRPRAGSFYADDLRNRGHARHSARSQRQGTGVDIAAGSGRTRVSPHEEILALVPDFRLDDVTAALFGGDRLASYDLPFPDIDANLLAIEQADFAAAIENGRPPEVDGAFGLRSLAIAYGFIDAERLGRAVTIDDLLAGRDSPYQDEIDAALAG